MISTIFGKTKPINYIIILGFLFFFYWFWNVITLGSDEVLEVLPTKIIVSAMLLFSVFLVDFIAHRNKLNQPNSYAILFYALLIVVFPETLLDDNVIACSMFLLFATRRLISIRSLKNSKLKIFDATIWVIIASFFYDWAILFLLLVFAAIYIYEPKNVRNWLVPFAALFTVFMISYSILILTHKTTLLSEYYNFNVNFDTSYFLNLLNSTKLALYVLVIFALVIYVFLKLGKSGVGKILVMRLVAYSFIIGLAVVFFSKTTDNSPIMITFFPAVIFIASYVEYIKNPKIREIILITSITIPMLVRFVGLLIQ